MNDVVCKILEENGYKISEDIKKFQENIRMWICWWEGYYEKFHKYQAIGADKKPQTIERYRMGMAKKVSEDWANLLLNEKTFIDVGTYGKDDTDPSKEQAFLTGDKVEQNGGIFGSNNFWTMANGLIERAYSSGTGAIVVHPKKMIVTKTGESETWKSKSLDIQFIEEAECIIPLSVEKGEITECAFCSEQTRKGQKYIYLSIHRIEDKDTGSYIVENKFYLINDGQYQQVPNFDNIVKSYIVTAKNFWIIKPNIKNNVNRFVPYGISVYANAIDQLKGCDLAFDSLMNDFYLGKKKVFVTQDAVIIGKDGEPVATDTMEQQLYVVMGKDTPPSQKQNIYNEYNPQLRVEENKNGIQFFLDLLSAKVGFGQHRYSFEMATMSTATEVKISNKDMTESVWKQRIMIQNVLIDMVRSILVIAKEKIDSSLDPSVKISVRFDDSMFTDEESERLQFMQEIRDGIRQKWEYRVKYLGEDEETAKAMVQKDEEGIAFEDEE